VHIIILSQHSAVVHAQNETEISFGSFLLEFDLKDGSDFQCSDSEKKSFQLSSESCLAQSVEQVCGLDPVSVHINQRMDCNNGFNGIAFYGGSMYFSNGVLPERKQVLDCVKNVLSSNFCLLTIQEQVSNISTLKFVRYTPRPTPAPVPVPTDRPTARPSPKPSLRNYPAPSPTRQPSRKPSMLLLPPTDRQSTAPRSPPDEIPPFVYEDDSNDAPNVDTVENGMLDGKVNNNGFMVGGLLTALLVTIVALVGLFWYKRKVQSKSKKYPEESTQNISWENTDDQDPIEKHGSCCKLSQAVETVGNDAPHQLEELGGGVINDNGHPPVGSNDPNIDPFQHGQTFKEDGLTMRILQGNMLSIHDDTPKCRPDEYLSSDSETATLQFVQRFSLEDDDTASQHSRPDFEPDNSWDPDDNSVGSADKSDEAFQATLPLRPISSSYSSEQILDDLEVSQHSI